MSQKVESAVVEASHCSAQAAEDEHRTEALPAEALRSDATTFLQSPSPGEPGRELPHIACGAQIGKYRIVRELGRGGQGRVFLARDESLGRYAALKTLTVAPAFSEEALRRFHNEARAVAQLQDPGIVQLFEVFEEGGLPFLAMEYVEGQTLLSLVRSRALTRRQIVEIMAAVCEAIGRAHEVGLIHRDLKPHNIMVTRQGTPKVMDFGLARSLRDEGGLCAATIEGQAIGSPAYMAPEQAAGRQSELGPHTDVYALGIVLYQCLSGQLPFSGDTPAEAMFRILHEEPEPLIRLDPTVGEDLSAICMKALEKDPARRYRNGSEMAADLRRWLRNEPVQARRATIWDGLAKALRRNYDLALVSGIALTLMTLMLTAALALFARQASRNAAEAVETQLKTMANTAAMMFAGDDLASLRPGEGAAGERFRDVVLRLNEIRRRNPQVSHACILRRSAPNRVQVVADADAFIKAGGVLASGYEWSPPPDSPLLKGFEMAFAERRPRPGPGGRTWSGYAPIVKSGGEVSGVLWLSLGAEGARTGLRPVLRTSLQVGALAAVLFTGFTAFAAFRVLKRKRLA